MVSRRLPLLLALTALAVLPAAGHRNLVPQPRHVELLGGFVRPAGAFEVTVLGDSDGTGERDPRV